MSERCFPNVSHDSLPGLTADEAYSELISSIQNLLVEYPPTRRHHPHSFCGFFYGPTSISFLLFHLSNLYPDAKINSQPLIYWSRQYLSLSRSLSHRAPDPAHCGVANEGLTSHALFAVLEKDEAAVRKLCNYAPTLLNRRVRHSCEWLYGLAGYLYLLRLCRTFLPASSDRINRAIATVTGFIIKEEQPWTWHGQEYYGAAHGTIGILTQLILSSPSDISASVLPILTNVLGTQLPSGNFPTSASWPHRDVLIQFCHGAPGFIVSLRSIARFFPSLRNEIATTIEAAESCIIERGVLRKAPCLCHGVYGNALALQKSDMAKFLKLTCQSDLEWAVEDDVDEKWGLYTGEGGRVWAMALVAKGQEGTYIGYNDL